MILLNKEKRHYLILSDYPEENLELGILNLLKFSLDP